MAVSLWQALSTHGWRCVGNAFDLKSGTLANANLKGSLTDWNTKFTLTLWYLWKWRCTLCMGSMSSILRDKIYFLLYKFEEVMSSLAQLGNGTAQTQGPQPSIMVHGVHLLRVGCSSIQMAPQRVIPVQQEGPEWSEVNEGNGLWDSWRKWAFALLPKRS